MGRGSGLSTAIPWDALLEAQEQMEQRERSQDIRTCLGWMIAGFGWCGVTRTSLLPPGSDAHGGGESNGAVSLLEGKEGRGQKPRPQETPSCPPVPSVLPSAPSVPQQTFHIATAPPHSTPKL